MADQFTIDGLKELRAALRAAPQAAVSEITRAAKPAAQQVTARAVEFAPIKSGTLRGSAAPTATSRSFGVRFTAPYAGVQEFAVAYYRRTRGSGRGRVTAGERRVAKTGGSAPSGSNEVHLQHVNGPPPRFAYRAIEELGPKLAETVVWPAILDVLRLHGWFVDG